MKELLLYTIFGFFLLPNTVGAYYTQDTYWSSEHEQPAWFESDSKDGFYGETVGGTYFTQNPIINSSNIRLHKFAIGSAFFYISDKGIIKADGDLNAVSIYLSKA